MWNDRLLLRVVWRDKVFHQTSNWIGNRVGNMNASVAKANTGISCCERHVRSCLHIHTIEHSPAEIESQVFQRLLAPHIADRVAPDVDWPLIRFMLWSSIIWPACIGFERVGEYVEARIRSCHRRKRYCIQWVNDRHRRAQVAV